MKNCNVAGCGRTHSAKGLCNLHYLRQKNGTPQDAPVRPGAQASMRCSGAGCDRDAKSRGLCHRHYQRMRFAELMAQGPTASHKSPNRLAALALVQGLTEAQLLDRLVSAEEQRIRALLAPSPSADTNQEGASNG